MSPLDLEALADALRAEVLVDAELVRLEDEELEEHILGLLERRLAGAYISIADKVRTGHASTSCCPRSPSTVPP